jgi:hypothetical protein
MGVAQGDEEGEEVFVPNGSSCAGGEDGVGLAFRGEEGGFEVVGCVARSDSVSVCCGRSKFGESFVIGESGTD